MTVKTIAWMLALIVVVLLTAPVMGANKDKDIPPFRVMAFEVRMDGYWPRDPDPSPAWLSYLYGPLAVVVILAPAFRNSRRTHLD
ncbi:hypothetical protein LCGC14_0095800 [marine sediment metagenome]|uniref:Uncharacterized protein n=1 Tax=marine sediment metagenome TaxID=412755 RepID=A0A0F9XW85_9ZZZZ|nr:hypothetical protein [Phycisphaerae bacterium]HDZ43625.1 hypothetical protein [Phycisphaerae bacterium]